MDGLDLKAAVENISMQNNISKEEILDVIRDVIVNEFCEYLNLSDEDMNVSIDEEYELHIAIIKEVVAEESGHNFEIGIEEAKKHKKDAEEGDTVEVKTTLAELSRRNVKKLNSVMMQKLRNIQKEILFREYKTKEGQLINGVFIRRNGRDMFIDIGKTEARLPYREQSPREFFKQGDKIKTYIKEVILDENNRLSIILSRTDPAIVSRLFELEVPEIADGVVKIKNIVREPGQKVKMSVYSTKTGVEPVGSCVGLSGIRIKAVINELSGEKIDVIPYSTNLKEFLARALQPAKVVKVLIINEEERESLIVVEDASYPLAIGKNGNNIKLASRLTDWTISVKTESQIQKHPEIMQYFSKAEELFTNVESDLHQLTEIDESILVRLMNAGVMNISELYEKTIEDVSRIEGIERKDAEFIRATLDELVEIVEDEDQAKEARQEYLSEFEDEIKGVDTDEKIKEEIQQVEYLVCPACSFEFEYSGQEKCPNCGVEFEFEEEVEEVVEE